MWYCAGKGDWKHKKEWLKENRTYANITADCSGGLVCRRCLAGQPGTSWQDFLFMKGWYDGDQQAAKDSALGDIARLVFKLPCPIFP